MAVEALAWRSTSTHIHTLSLSPPPSGPIHCLAFNKHRRRLVAGGQGVVFVYAVKENVPKETSLDEKKHRELNQQMLAKNYRPTDGDGDGVKLVPNMRAQVRGWRWGYDGKCE